MKWIFKKLIVVLIEALIVAGLLDALGVDLEGILDGLLGDESADSNEPSSDTVDA